MKMNKTLLRLASNPNIFGINYLKTIANKSDDSRESLEYVVGEDMVARIVNAEFSAPLKSAGYVNPDMLGKEVNTVFVWGQAKSGKTSLVASLLASAEETVFLGEQENVARGKCMVEMFCETGGRYKIVNPGDSKDVEVIQVGISKRVGLFKKFYPEVFVETLMPNDVSDIHYIADLYLKSALEQIHIFCIDCSGNIDVQAKKVTQMLDYLDKIGCITRTNGVYIAVTKSDMMYRVPRMYREQAAQTLITAGQRELWQRICNICYDKGIFGATPLVYTIGDVKFQQMVVPDLTTARRILINPILHKSQPRLTWFVRVLRMFNEKVTAIVFSLVLVFAAWGIFNLISIDGIVPEGKNVPYDYQKEFLARVNNEIAGKSYSDSHKVYDELLKDINHEKSILTANGDSLLSSRVVYTCDSVLMNTFADIVHEVITKELESNSWNKVLLSDCKGYCHSMNRDGVLGDDISGKLKADYETIYVFFNKVEPIYTKHVKSCSSLDDIKNVAKEVELYNTYPYINNVVTRQGLHNAVGDAMKSCANKLKADASKIANEYQKIENQLEYIPYYDFFSARKDKMKKQMNTLKSKAVALHIRIGAFSDYANDHGISDANGILNEAKRIIKDI